MRDIDKELAELNEKAVTELKDILTCAESDDVRRKAAVDILNFSNVGKAKSRAPQVTEEQLDVLGRVIGEAVEIREGLIRREGPVGSPA